MITETLNEETTKTKNPRLPSAEDAELSREDHKPGSLLSLPKKRAAKLLEKMWEASEPYMKRRFAEWRVNVLRRLGIPGVGLIKSGDDWSVWVMPDVSGPDQVPIINKAAEVARKFVSIMLADPFKPQVRPAGTSDKEIISAQIATRVLEQIEGESGLSEDHTMRRAFNKANDYGSGFVHYYVDVNGGPRVPVQIEASPFATHVDTALVDPVTQQDFPGPYVQKYVMEDGTLSDLPEGARMKDLPVLRREILTGRNVRFVPHTAEDIWDAEGVLIGTFVPLVKLRNRFPDEMEKLEEDKEELEKLIGYRPPNSKAIASAGQDLTTPDLEAGDDYEDSMIFVLTGYFRKSSAFPKGAVVITLGGKHLVHRQDWSFERDDGTEEVLDIPVTQYAQFDEGDDDPYLHGIMSIIGRANELRNAQASAIIALIERMAARKTFIPYASMVSEEDLEDPNKKYIAVADGQAPTFEQIPNVSQDTWHLYNEAGTEMDRAPGMGDTVQGLETPSVKSGRQALAVVQQAHAALSSVKANLQRGYERGGRIKLQLIRAFFHDPQNFSFEMDEAFKLDMWRSSDLGNARDVVMAPGSGTMLTPAAKAQLAEHWFSLGLIPPDEMQRMTVANIGPLLALQSDPFRTRIQRQVNEWLAGPPEGWKPAPPQMMMDPQTGQPQPIPAPDPALLQIWEPVPSDNMPAVAQIRMTELARLMASERYRQKPREWRMGVDQEFMNMSMAVQGQAPNPTMGGPNQAQAQVSSGSPAQQEQGKDMLGSSNADQDPMANSSARLSESESAMSGGNL